MGAELPVAHEYLSYLADTFLDADELPASIDYCRERLHDRREHASDDTCAFLDSLSWQIVLIYERMGKYEEAITDAEQCVEWDIEADRPEAGEHIAYLESLRVLWLSQQGHDRE